jgi:hypothetical protein
MSDNDFQEFTSGFGKKQFNRLLKLIRKNRPLLTRPGMSQTDEGVDIGPFVEGGANATFQKWRLRTVDAELGTVSILNPGKIYTDDYADGSGEITITGISSEVTPTAGQYLLLTLTNTAGTITMAFSAADEWTEHPEIYKADTSGAEPVLEKVYLPLYKIVASATETEESRTVSINDTIKAVRYIGNYDLRLYDTFKEVDGVIVPVLEPFPAVFSF